MVLNQNVSNLKQFHPGSSTVIKICDDIVDKLYNVNQERYKKLVEIEKKEMK